MKKVSLYLEFCIKLKEFDKWKGIFCGHGRKFDNVPIDYKMELHLLNSMGGACDYQTQRYFQLWLEYPTNEVCVSFSESRLHFIYELRCFQIYLKLWIDSSSSTWSRVKVTRLCKSICLAICVKKCGSRVLESCLSVRLIYTTNQKCPICKQCVVYSFFFPTLTFPRSLFNFANLRLLRNHDIVYRVNIMVGCKSFSLLTRHSVGLEELKSKDSGRVLV